MTIRAGFWRRALAVLVDMAVAQLVLQGLVAILFAATDGRVVTTDGLSGSCRAIAGMPAGVALPPGVSALEPKLCSSHVLGAPLRAVV